MAPGEGRGSRRTKQLREGRDLWPTYAEYRAASLLLKVFEAGTRVELEFGKHEGTQPDFPLVSRGPRTRDT